MDDELSQGVDELLRLTEDEPEPAIKFDASLVCYPEQLAVVRSKAKRKLLRKTRRAGGTVGLASWYLEGALTPPFANQLYVTTTLKNAKRLVWPTLKKLNAQ